jgi:mutator protein MutT
LDNLAAPRYSVEPMKHLEAAIAIITRGEKVLVCQRRNDDKFGGLWEFPGGKVEAGETVEDCLHREVREELGIAVRIVKSFPPVDHQYPHAFIRLHPFHCQWESGVVQHLACQDSRWIDPQNLTDHTFPPANDGLVAEVIAYLMDKVNR